MIPRKIWSCDNSSAQGRMGAVRRGARSSSLAGSLGRRSHPLSIRLPSPILTIRFAPLRSHNHCDPGPPRVRTLPFPPPHALHSRKRGPPSFPHAAGVRGKITRFVTTIPSASSTYHFYELDVADLDAEWLESKERRREWVDYAEAVRRLSWKAELAQGLSLSTLAPKR